MRYSSVSGPNQADLVGEDDGAHAARPSPPQGTSQSFAASSAGSRPGDGTVGVRWTRAAMPMAMNARNCGNGPRSAGRRVEDAAQKEHAGQDEQDVHGSVTHSGHPYRPARRLSSQFSSGHVPSTLGVGQPGQNGAGRRGGCGCPQDRFRLASRFSRAGQRRAHSFAITHRHCGADAHRTPPDHDLTRARQLPDSGSGSMPRYDKRAHWPYDRVDEGSTKPPGSARGGGRT